jgi:DNA-directed RNA polymerase specialized sigma subunit
MAARKSQLRTRTPAKLSTLFTRPYCSDPSSTFDLWRKHFAGDADATAALFEFYAPLCMIVAARYMRRFRGTWPTETFDDVLSDASLGLLTALRLTPGGPHFFNLFAQKEINKTIHRQWQMRRWGGRRGSERASVVAEIRAKLTAEEGRLPTPGEMGEALQRKISNPNLAVHGDPRIYAASQDKNIRREMLATAEKQSPDRRAIEAETMRLARKGMTAEDFKLLKMVLSGMEPAAIARRVGLDRTTVADRLNGVLWLCRCNADLARHLGVQPATMPEKRNGRLPRIESLQDFLAMMNEGKRAPRASKPARLAVSA